MIDQFEKKEELRAISKRLNTKGAPNNLKSAELIERYNRLAKGLKNGPVLNDAASEKSILLAGQGRLCEAIRIFEERMIDAPQDIVAHQLWKSLLDRIHNEMLHLAEFDPEAAEFGRTYEKFVEIGYVGSFLHLGAIRHYLSSGQSKRASEIALAIFKVAPGTPGLSGMIMKLADVSDDVQIQKLDIVVRSNK